MRYVIPLTPEPQRFSIVLAGRELLLAVRWMDAPEGGWLLDMADAEGVPLVSGIPLAAGSTPDDHVRACMKAFSAKGIEPGYIPLLPGQKLPRGKVMYGMARAYMRDTARRTGTAWSFQKGKMQMVPASGYLPGEAVVLSAGTGLIGTPKANDKGIEIKCLLNPRLRIGGRVRLDNAGGAGLKAGTGREPRDVHDGLYRILSITFSGDTRGTDWYATLSCVGIDDTSQLPLDEAR